MQSVDWATGIAVLTAPHGLAAKTKVAIVPNSYALDGIMSFPGEFMNLSGYIHLTPVDAVTVKITDLADAVIAINTASIGNSGNLDITKFHFEKISDWSITNIPLPKIMRLKTVGYVRNKNDYRYTNLKYKSTDGNSYSMPGQTTSQFSGYLNILGFPSIPNANNYNGVFAKQNWIIDYSNPHIELIVDSMFVGRRISTATHTADAVRETSKYIFYPALREVVGIAELSIYTGYGYTCNGTVIELWDMGGK